MRDRERLRVVLQHCSASRSQICKVDAPVKEVPSQLIARAALWVTTRPVEWRERDIGENVGEDVRAAHSTLVAIWGCSCSDGGDRCLAVRMNHGHWSAFCAHLSRDPYCYRKRNELSSVSRGSCRLGIISCRDVQYYRRMLLPLVVVAQCHDRSCGSSFASATEFGFKYR